MLQNILVNPTNLRFMVRIAHLNDKLSIIRSNSVCFIPLDLGSPKVNLFVSSPDCCCVCCVGGTNSSNARVNKASASEEVPTGFDSVSELTNDTRLGVGNLPA